MRRITSAAVTAALVSTLLAATGAPAGADRAEPPAHRQVGLEQRAKPDIARRVAALPSVTSVRERPAPRGYRFFVIRFTQPVDHHHPSNGTFEQRLTLLHKNAARPMVMETGGYYVYTFPWRSEPTQIVDGNQLSMEYRFFRPSRPANPDWPSELTIWQAAADEHKVIREFKHIYRQDWLTTGGSKGGMTATYHRRFFPDDVSGTVPYVAPNDVVDDDDVYNEFLAQVGDDQQCRDDLVALQRRVLSNRAWFTQRTREESETFDYTYRLTGGLKKGLEVSVVDMYFTFWQYSLQSDCARVPDAATASNQQVWNFFQSTSPLTGYADQNAGPYVPYYYQAAYQLGAPEPYEGPIADLLHYPGLDVASTFVPDSLKPIDFDEAAMPDIDQWVSTASTEMLYIYGANDPWGAEPFTCGQHARLRHCASYFVEGGNHGASIRDLPRAERLRSTRLVLSWAGLGAADQAVKQIARAGAPKRIAALDIRPDEARRLIP